MSGNDTRPSRSGTAALGAWEGGGAGKVPSAVLGRNASPFTALAET
jgi:hypothetical protein